MIVGMFIVTWVAALSFWKFGRVEKMERATKSNTIRNHSQRRQLTSGWRLTGAPEWKELEPVVRMDPQVAWGYHSGVARILKSMVLTSVRAWTSFRWRRSSIGPYAGW